MKLEESRTLVFMVFQTKSMKISMNTKLYQKNNSIYKLIQNFVCNHARSEIVSAHV